MKKMMLFLFCLMVAGSTAYAAGDLVVYSPNSDGLLNASIPAFEKNMMWMWR